MLVLRFRNPSSYLLVDYEYYGPTVVAGVTRVAHDRVNCRFMSRQTSGVFQRRRRRFRNSAHGLGTNYMVNPLMDSADWPAGPDATFGRVQSPVWGSACLPRVHVRGLGSSRQDAKLGSTWPWPRCNPQGFTQGGWLESESFLTPLVLGVTLGSSCLVYGYRVCMLDLGTTLGASRQGAWQWSAWARPKCNPWGFTPRCLARE
ncbi:hypothetical protein BHE74_00005396 [Ensete ventricosum]|nr:hypothetical protein BHE74_00005396 [Ensete ventricosum]